MGNSNSQQQVLPPQWAHSYPRPRPIPPHIKVLPERVAPLKLRTTDNGAILQNGGTISGRKPTNGPEERVYRPRSSSAHRPPRPEELTLDKNRFGSEPDLRFHAREHREHREQFSENAVRQRISRSRKKYKAPPAPPNGSGMDSSSPDLNGWDHHPGDFTSPGRRVRLFKTRAETNKKNLSKKLENAESDLSETINVPRPKLREESRSHSTNGEKEILDRLDTKGLRRAVSQEAISSRKNLSTPEFQAELLEAAQRIRPKSAMLNQRESPVGGPSNSPKPHPRSRIETDVRRSRLPERSKENVYRSKPSQDSNNSRCRNDKPQGAQNEVRKVDKTDRDVPSKTFYFGMEENNNEVKNVNNYASTNNVDKTNAEHRITAVEKSKNLMNMYKSAEANGNNQEWEESMEKFAASFHRSPVTLPNGNTTSCSSSFVSDPDEDVDGGIALQLRPTLPKKQLEIPRFSPTAAWRLLSTIDALCPPAPSPTDSEDGPLLEDRIHAPLSQQAIRSNHDKSGDSGISGDASPGGCHESSSEIAITSAKGLSQNPKPLLMAWTPQQDLEEESSSDDLESPLNSSKNATSNIPGAKFSTRNKLFANREQPFSMSLPREERVGLYPENNEAKVRSNVVDHTARFNSLKKLKAALVTSKRNNNEDNSLPHDSNWVLSRSVPSSLTNGHIAATRSISSPSSPEQDDELQASSLKYPSYSYLATEGRMMYLPEYHARLSPDSRNKTSGNMCDGYLSKSCENISTEMRQLGRTPSPVVSQNNEDNRYHTEGNRAQQKKKKFAFQSTVRLIENRRLAERLSREAELKENQRLSELEAMKKVEEEFQKKRAREKANIRHQLRLFSLEENNYSSLPPMEWRDNRAEPDGAPSSLPPVSAQQQNHSSRKSTSSRKSSGLGEGNKFTPTTQVLSEFREPMRDYRDYRHARYHDNLEPPAENIRRSIVEHPRVVYDMPKNTPVFVSANLASAQNQYNDNDHRGGISTPRSSSSDNYRKDFAHGALPVGGRSLASSDSELSQPHTRPTSRQGIMAHRFNAVQRSRSASPASLRSSSISPPQDLRSSSVSPPRSRSASPIRIIINHRSRSPSPNRIIIGVGRSASTSPSRENISIVACSSPSSDERNLSESPTTNEGPSSLESHPEVENNPDSQNFVKPVTTNSLPRIGLTSLQPFKKTGKEYRPIIFNPINNKLAQTVN